MTRQDIHEDCLLGGDFIAAHVKQFDYDTDSMILRQGGARVQMVCESQPPSTTALSVRIEAATRTVLQPRTVQVLRVAVKDSELWRELARSRTTAVRAQRGTAVRARRRTAVKARRGTAVRAQ